MKKILFILMMTLMSFSYANATINVDKHEYSEKELYVINVNIPVKLKIYEGEDFCYDIRTSEDDLMDKVKCEFNDKNELNIFIDDKSSYNKFYDSDGWILDENKIKISLVIPKPNYDKIKIKTNSNNLLVKNIKINTTKDYENK